DRKIELDTSGAPTVKQMIERLRAKYESKFENNFIDANGELRDTIVLLINGKNFKQYSSTHSNPYDTELGENDDISFIVPFGGG
ncbi:MAG: MoaD/ThiS family protein, partial [Promethearchaeota archaeon]